MTVQCAASYRVAPHCEETRPLEILISTQGLQYFFDLTRFTFSCVVSCRLLFCVVSRRVVSCCLVLCGVVLCCVVLGRVGSCCVVSRCVVFRGVVLDAILDHCGYHFDISFSHHFRIGFGSHFLTSARRKPIDNRHRRGLPAI